MARLQAERLARSTKPFLARGGSQRLRCPGCRLPTSHCLCAWRPTVATRAGMCLLMADDEPLKPSNTGWLVADVVADTFAFGWARTNTDPGLPALLGDPQWQPLLVFPQEYASACRVVHAQAPPPAAGNDGRLARPLFILLDGTWSQARKMFRKTPALDTLPVLSLQPEQLSRYRLRRSNRDAHLCTSEVAASCLVQAGDVLAALCLQAYLDVFTHHVLQARNQQPFDADGAAHRALRALASP